MGLLHLTFLTLKLLPGDMEKIEKLLTDCRRNIPGLVEMHFGEHTKTLFAPYSDRSQGYTHALVTRHLTSDSLKEYMKSTEHLILRQFLQHRGTKELISVDFAISKI